MDDHVMMDNMDDLFGEGDGEHMGAAMVSTMPQAPDSKALILQVEQSHITGCCNKLAWAKNGSVARISSDGRKITFQTLVPDSKTGVWALGPESPYPITAEGDACFQHIEWSGLGMELVAVDQLGRCFIYNTAYALGRLQQQVLHPSSQQDELNTLVGLHWLPVYPNDLKRPLITPCSRQGERWVSGLKPRDGAGVYHPADGRTAFFGVTRGNQLKLVYQQDSQNWAELVSDLGELTDSGDLITHAAFGDGSDYLLMVTYDSNKRLRLYRIRIAWNPSQVHIHGQQTTTAVNPQLHVSHSKLMGHCAPQTQPANTLNDMSYLDHQEIGAQLAHLYILPPAVPMSSSDPPSSYTVMAVFTQLGNVNQMPNSVIARWDLQPSEPVLHESFKSLRPGSDKTGSNKPVTRLQRREDIVVPKAILSMTSYQFHTLLAFPASDGTVDFRARHSMDLIVADSDDSKASSLPQSGFTFTLTEQCASVSLSPSASMAARLTANGDLDLCVAQYLHGWTEASSESQKEAAIECLAREYSILCSYGHTNDEVLALIPFDLERSLRRKFVTEVLRILHRNTDFSMEEFQKQGSRVFRDSLLQRVLGAQLALGYKGRPGQSDIPGKFAWAFLNVRLSCQALAQSVPANQPVRPDVLISLRGAIKWSLDIFVSIVDDLITLSRNCRSQNRQLNRELIQSQVDDLNTPSLHLVTHSASRSLLRFLIDCIKAFFAKTSQALQYVRTIAQKSQLGEILSTLKSMPFSVLVFEQLLQETDTRVRGAYTQAEASVSTRSICEHNMLVEAEVPQLLMPVITNLLTGMMDKLQERPDVDVGKLYFWDTTWLGLKDDEASKAYLKQHRFDVIRKTEIRKGAKVRVCRRCGSCMEDLPVSLGRDPPWLVNVQKVCVCYNYWMVQ